MAGLMTVDNLVVGTDLTIGDANGGEVQGDKFLILFTLLDSVSVNSGFKCFNIITLGGDDRGFIATRAGSITGITNNYNVSASSGDAEFKCSAFIAGAEIFVLDLDKTIADNKVASITQTRGVDTFIAGDVIRSAWRITVGTATVNSQIMMMEIMYDA